PKPVPNIVPEPLAQPVFEPVSQPIEFVSAIDETLSSAVPESEPATITETISETWSEPVPETVAQSLPIVEPQDDPSMAFNDALLDGLDEELDRALELEMEQSLREEAFADLSTTAPEPELEPEPQRESQPATPNDAEALLEAFRAEEIAMGQTPAAAIAAAPQASDVDELSAALSDALAMYPAPGEQSAEDFEQELARLMGEAKGARPQPAAAAPPPAEPAFAQSFEKSFETAAQPESQPSLHPSFQPAPPPPPQPIPMDGEALQAPGQPVPPTPAMVEPQLDYSDPVEEFAALDDRWQDQTAPVQDASQSAPAPIDPPALSMMERVLGSASALGFAAKGQPHNPSFDESFSQAFDEALSADLAADQATDAVQPAPAKAASMTPPVAPSAPAPMPRSPEPVAVTAPAAPRVAAAPSVSAFGPDNSVFSDPSLQNQVEPVAAAPQKKSGKKVAAVIAAIALIGGGAAFAYSYFADSSADAPTLMARTDAVKEKPKDAGGRVVPNQDQSVFKADDGAATAAPAQEQLQDGSEEPVAIARAKAEDRTTGIDGATPGRLVQPRRVRTVTVRPDGTIVSSTADDAPSAVVPNVSLNPLTDIGVAPSATPAPTAAPTPVPTQTVAPSAPSTGFTYNAPTAPSSTDAPAPDPLSVASAPSAAEPVKTPVQAVPTPKPTAPAPTPPTSAATVNEDGISTGPAPPFAVQVSSQRSAAAANQTYRTLSRRYASLLDGKGVDIRRIEISGRGVFYRVRIPAQTQVEANSLCSDLKAQGGDCFVTR
ncbi:MAG: SPOR domain-containing protein, partial [Pseudomonadota bacterium]